ncbi:MAG: hypothetical protein IIW19_06095, partial [Clostridia bacterium]|nr:hypothetical protein [Clostridia bacterium]
KILIRGKKTLYKSGTEQLLYSFVLRQKACQKGPALLVSHGLHLQRIKRSVKSTLLSCCALLL